MPMEFDMRQCVKEERKKEGKKDRIGCTLPCAWAFAYREFSG